MEVYVARQPILNKKLEVFAYELLYRDNQRENVYLAGNDNHATSEVINSFLQFGINDLSEGKPCFINFTETLLENTIPTFLQPELMVIEVLESVRPTDQIIETCQNLKKLGYRIALDDFECREEDENFHKLIHLADIIKIDIQKTSRTEQLRIMNRLQDTSIVFLAEKVETREEYEQCVKDGYTYFQGYFFSKPVTLSTRDLPVLHHNLFILISELSKEEPDIDKITQYIESDVSLSYKLLRLLNSPAIGLVYEIKSIKQSIVLLGLIELRKWIYVISFRERYDKSDRLTEEVIKLSLTRAKASELIALHLGNRKDSSRLFLTGLFSLVDTIYKQPLIHILKNLPLEQVIKDTLLGKETSLTSVKNLVCAAEKGEWSKMDALAGELGINAKSFNNLYKQSVKWARDVMLGKELV